MVRRQTTSETSPPDLKPPPEPPDVSVCAHDDNSVCHNSASQRGMCDEQLREAQRCAKNQRCAEKKPETMRAVRDSLPSKSSPEPSGKKSIVKDCSSYDSGAVDANYEDGQRNVESTNENKQGMPHRQLRRETCHQLQRITCHRSQQESSQFSSNHTSSFSSNHANSFTGHHPISFSGNIQHRDRGIHGNHHDGRIWKP